MGEHREVATRSGSGPLMALIAAILLGPVGIALAMVQRRADRHAGERPSGLTTVALVVGVVQTLALAGIGVNLLRTDISTAKERSVVERAVDNRTPGPRASSTLPPPEEGETEPEAAAISDYLPSEVAGMTTGPVTDEADTLAKGAESAVRTTYTKRDRTIEVRTARWPSDTAAEEAVTAIQSELAGADFTKTGEFGAPRVGTYWYYERAGVGTLLWIQDGHVSRATGDPMTVQEYFTIGVIPYVQ